MVLSMSESNLVLKSSYLVNYAKRELELLGVNEEDTAYILKIVESFASYGHSGSSAIWAIEILYRLLRFQPLTPLTTNPEEWIEVGELVWQSARNPEAFSNDGGYTYKLLSDNSVHQSAFYRIPTKTKE